MNNHAVILSAFPTEFDEHPYQEAFYRLQMGSLRPLDFGEKFPKTAEMMKRYAEEYDLEVWGRIPTAEEAASKPEQ